MYLSELSSKLKGRRKELQEAGSISADDYAQIEERYKEEDYVDDSEGRPRTIVGRSVVRAKMDLVQVLGMQERRGTFPAKEELSTLTGVNLESDIGQALASDFPPLAKLHARSREEAVATAIALAFAAVMLHEFDEMGQLKTRVTTQLGSIKHVEEEVVRENLRLEVESDLERRGYKDWSTNGKAGLDQLLGCDSNPLMENTVDIVHQLLHMAPDDSPWIMKKKTKVRGYGAAATKVTAGAAGAGAAAGPAGPNFQIVSTKLQAPTRSKYISYAKEWDPFNRVLEVLPKEEGARLAIDAHWIGTFDSKGKPRDEFLWCCGDENTNCEDDHDGAWLEKVLGAGSFGKVFLGSYRGEAVAVKTFPDDMGGDDQAVFINEVTIMSKMGRASRHSVGIVAASLRPPNLCLVMSLYQGGTLYDALYKHNVRMSPEQVLRICFQATSALDAMHKNNLMHRDFKPDNILLSGDHRHLVLADFGVSTMLHLSDMVNHVQFPVGTPVYMAPEVWHKNPYGHRADIYSLGVFFVELLTGKEPHSEAVASRGWEAVVNDVANNNIKLRPQCPSNLPEPLSGLADLARLCMNHDSSSRPYAHEIVTHLRQIASSFDLDSTTQPLVPLPDVPPFVPRHAAAEPKKRRSSAAAQQHQPGHRRSLSSPHPATIDLERLTAAAAAANQREQEEQERVKEEEHHRRAITPPPPSTSVADEVEATILRERVATMKAHLETKGQLRGDDNEEPYVRQTTAAGPKRIKSIRRRSPPPTTTSTKVDEGNQHQHEHGQQHGQDKHGHEHEHQEGHNAAHYQPHKIKRPHRGAVDTEAHDHAEPADSQPLQRQKSSGAHAIKRPHRGSPPPPARTENVDESEDISNTRAALLKAAQEEQAQPAVLRTLKDDSHRMRRRGTPPPSQVFDEDSPEVLMVSQLKDSDVAGHRVRRRGTPPPSKKDRPSSTSVDSEDDNDLRIERAIAAAAARTLASMDVLEASNGDATAKIRARSNTPPAGLKETQPASNTTVVASAEAMTLAPAAPASATKKTTKTTVTKLVRHRSSAGKHKEAGATAATTEPAAATELATATEPAAATASATADADVSTTKIISAAGRHKAAKAAKDAEEKNAASDATEERGTTKQQLKVAQRDREAATASRKQLRAARAAEREVALKDLVAELHQEEATPVEEVETTVTSLSTVAPAQVTEPVVERAVEKEQAEMDEKKVEQTEKVAEANVSPTAVKKTVVVTRKKGEQGQHKASMKPKGADSAMPASGTSGDGTTTTTKKTVVKRAASRRDKGAANESETGVETGSVAGDEEGAHRERTVVVLHRKSSKSNMEETPTHAEAKGHERTVLVAKRKSSSKVLMDAVPTDDAKEEEETKEEEEVGVKKGEVEGVEAKKEEQVKTGATVVVSTNKSEGGGEKKKTVVGVKRKTTVVKKKATSEDGKSTTKVVVVKKKKETGEGGGRSAPESPQGSPEGVRRTTTTTTTTTTTRATVRTKKSAVKEADALDDESIA